MGLFMHIRVLPAQIVKIWDVIKFAVAKVYKIEAKQADFIFNNALHELLNDKYQCFVHLSDDGERKIKAIVFTAININKLSGVKTLDIPCLYSFAYHTMEEWDDFFKIILEFSKQEKAFPITCSSNNERVWEICNYLGFEESSRNFTYNKGER